MKDTPDVVSETYRRLLMRCSSAQRLRMGSDMFDAARALVRASLGDPNSTDVSAQMKARIFQRVYGLDFDDATRARIVAFLLKQKS